MPLPLPLLITALFSFIAWRSPRSGLLLLLVTLPSYLLRTHFGPLPTTVLELNVLALFAIWSIQKIRLHRSQIGRQFVNCLYYGGSSSLAVPVALLFLSSILAIFFSPDTLSAFGLWRAYFLEPALIFLIARDLFTTEQDWRRAYLALGLGAAISTLFALFQVTTGFGIPVPWDVERRATGLYDFPNAFGLFAAPLVSALWCLRYRILATTAFIGLLLSQTEAGVVAVVVVGLLMWLVDKIRSTKSEARNKSEISNSKYVNRFRIFFPLLVAFLLSLFSFLSPSLSQKLLLLDESGLTRRAQWKETVLMLKDHPLTGAGLGGYPEALIPYHDATYYEIFQYPHNIILNLWTELGLLGLLSSLALFIILTKIAWNKKDDPMVVSSYVALLTMVVHGLVDVPFFKNDLAVLTAMVVAGIVAKRK